MPIFSKPSPELVIQTAAEVIPLEMADDLLALILHGPHSESPSDGQRLQRVPINLLIVLRQIDAGTMNRLAKAFNKIRGHDQVVPMVMTIKEMNASTDVFPITFLDIRRNHRLLAGQDVLTDLEIQFTHLRLRCEQELKNLQLRMQNNYLRHCGNLFRMLESMRRHYVSFARTMGAVMLLMNKDVSKNKQTSLSESAECLGLDQALIARIAQTSSPEIPGNKVTLEVLSSTFAAFIDLVGQAAAAIDGLPEQVMLVEILEDEKE